MRVSERLCNFLSPSVAGPISEDVKTRPREHVRDDAGHSSSAITDKYIDIERRERAQSARNKKL